ncbi:hypothetical protein C1645_140870 [Glomus cerebriforme]|uniref:Uncharacterized protein n=1 Tax=Glomus cerebriforme TaxID=658196 RepID=A0A397TJE5_9GLOM|nr:hypothetical protein C1645_140870 [Glomus cerebriforme]
MYKVIFTYLFYFVINIIFLVYKHHNVRFYVPYSLGIFKAAIYARHKVKINHPRELNYNEFAF